MTPEQEALLAQIREQERVNAVMQVAERIGDQAAQTITDGLLKIVDGTVKVGDAFQQMAKSIIDSFAQILISESLRGLVRLGLGVLFGALGGGASGAGASLGTAFFSGASAAGGGGAYSTGVDAGAVQIATPSQHYQHGGVVTKPTYAMLGENPATSPETILTRQQMQGLMSSAMRAGPSAGGQGMGGDVVIINVPNEAAGAREAAKQRGLGNRVIINAITDELSQGAGSRIRRALTAGGH